jgi:ferredoxin-NADP reductase
VYANQSEEDIILKDRLDALAKKHPNFKARRAAGGGDGAAAAMAQQRRRRSRSHGSRAQPRQRRQQGAVATPRSPLFVV